MNSEIELHSYEIQRLQSMSKEEILKRKLLDLIKSYKSGELSAADLRLYTNINPDEIHLFDPDVVPQINEALAAVGELAGGICTSCRLGRSNQERTGRDESNSWRSPPLTRAAERFPEAIDVQLRHHK